MAPVVATGTEQVERIAARRDVQLHVDHVVGEGSAVERRWKRARPAVDAGRPG